MNGTIEIPKIEMCRIVKTCQKNELVYYAHIIFLIDIYKEL